jgi:UDP-N-acetylmuramoyl-L-alanine---L-glutamate ligase
MKIEKLKKYNDKKIAILWFWKEGRSSLEFLTKLWFSNITILDKNTKIEQQKNINYILGEKYIDSLWSFDLIIKSPWISPYNEKIKQFAEKITSQIQIFIDNYKGSIIWITWTKGKSTVSTLLFLTLIQAWFRTKLVWNIGNPVLEEIDLKAKPYDYIVFEMSSYMLEWLNPKLFIWYLNNMYSCHFDWHSWKENYQNAKLNLLKYSENKIANIETKNSVDKIGNIVYFGASSNYVYNGFEFLINSESVLKDENIIIKWEHNRLNISWIIAILDILVKKQAKPKYTLSHLISSLSFCLRTFSWLSHRIEYIWTYNKIDFIDDAIATTPESTIAAIKTFEHNIWTLLLWWKDSWFEFEKLVKNIVKYKISNIVLFPDTWEKIFWDLSEYNYETEFYITVENHKIKILKTKFMKSAVKFAYKNTPEWKICLLSNASPSFSLWSWYIEKGLQYQEEVKKQAIK